LRLVASGFPAASDDYADKKMNLHELLVKNPPATFFLRVSGNDFSAQQIYSGDLLVVDRSLPVQKSSLVVVTFEGVLCLDRFLNIKPQPALQFIRPFPVESSDFSIWGVVSYVIRDSKTPSDSTFQP
jgi:DNA polymerase V